MLQLMNPMANDAGRRVHSCVQIVTSILILFASILVAQSNLSAQESSAAKAHEEVHPQPPKIATASDEAKNAMQVFQMPSSVTATVFAAEPDIANPVAIDVDHLGRVFVCESFRQENGVEDNRNHPEWLRDDLAAQTVQDRIAYMRKHHNDDVIEYYMQDDRIRLLQDTDGDGTADKSSVFANHFNSLAEGTGAGVLATRDGVYYTCIPNLWKIKDLPEFNKSDSLKRLHSGFGVRFAFRGHDLHGLIIGPDGRLYFSIGDRGYHVNQSISDPESGAVFRCELDGSNLEVIATGLRNPQELAFDDYGNLFTGDNNSDSGDKARMVYVVEGSDSGWRMSYQYLPDRGPFNREKIWYPYNKEVTPAYIVPPIDNFADGPSGFAFYPGTGFSPEMDGRFLLCDFRGQTSGSGVKTFRLKPEGAFFTIADEQNTFWNILATDCCFGPDGRLYISDWVHGWDGIGKGRIYAFKDSRADDKLVAEVQQLLKQGLNEKSDEQLSDLLGHRDRRVRLEAQFEWVRRSKIDPLIAIARDANRPELARIHAMWALNQGSRLAVQKASRKTSNWQVLASASLSNQVIIEVFCELISSTNGEIRRQAVRLLGQEILRANEIAEVNNMPGNRRPKEAQFDLFDKSTIAKTIALLDSFCVSDEDARLAFFAAPSASESAVLEMLARNSSDDPIIRHAGIMRLSKLKSLTKAMTHPSAHVRVAAVVAARKMILSGSEKAEASDQGNRSRRMERTGPRPKNILRKALNDKDPNVVLEAARAVHDLPVVDMLKDLAKVSLTEESSDALVRRVLNASYRLGDSESLDRLKNVAINSSLAIERRRDAIHMIRDWAEPDELDLVLGMWRPIEKQGRADPRPAATALIEAIEELPKPLFEPALEAATKHKIKSASTIMLKMFRDPSTDLGSRLQAFQGLTTLGASETDVVVKEALASQQWQVRVAALEHLHRTKSNTLLPELRKSFAADGDVRELQAALRLIGQMDDKASGQELAMMLPFFEGVPLGARLDLIQAGLNRTDLATKKLFEDAVARKNAKQPNFMYQMTKVGGDYEKGKEIFFNRGDVSCLRCHKIQGSGGDVGPNLSDIGAQKNRDYLLESLIKPSETIAENFETVVVLDLNGKTHVGVKKASTKETLSIMTADAIMINIPQDDIDEIRNGKSAMPDDVTKHLSLAEIRDLIEYMAQQQKPDATIKEKKDGKSNAPSAGHGH